MLEITTLIYKGGGFVGSDVGVWRTVGGRKIFRQDLKDAMKESGKFQKKINRKEISIEDIRNIKKEYEKIISEYEEKSNLYFNSNKKEDEENFDSLIKERDLKINAMLKEKTGIENDNDLKKYKDIFYRNKMLGVPLEASFEISKFKIINQSPYSQSYYNSNDISWGSKPEGSIRISDHWNFTSYGGKEIHCELKGIKGYQENRWIMAKYCKGKYEIIKEFEVYE